MMLLEPFTKFTMNLVLDLMSFVIRRDWSCSYGILVNFAPRFANIERYFYDKELGDVLTVNGSIVKSQ
jgi:hypothetical protein